MGKSSWAHLMNGPGLAVLLMFSMLAHAAKKLLSSMNILQTSPCQKDNLVFALIIQSPAHVHRHIDIEHIAQHIVTMDKTDLRTNPLVPIYFEQDSKHPPKVVCFAHAQLPNAQHNVVLRVLTNLGLSIVQCLPRASQKVQCLLLIPVK